MNVVSYLRDEQKALIPDYIEKWKSKAFLTSPVEPVPFERGAKDLCAELGLPIPQEFLYFPGPPAMWGAFESWKSKITRVLTQIWSYQVPLCDPLGMHR